MSIGEMLIPADARHNPGGPEVSCMASGLWPAMGEPRHSMDLLLGRREDALAAIQEATATYRELATARPGRTR